MSGEPREFLQPRAHIRRHYCSHASRVKEYRNMKETQS